jgi:hypothetical protein
LKPTDDAKYQQFDEQVRAKEESLKPSDDAKYQQIYEQVRAKDDISFKLLGLVPLISGAGISILVKTNIDWGLKCFVSAFGATVTFSIFRWELRNIQWCNWLLERAKRVEGTGIAAAPSLQITPGPRRVFGKTESEVVLYSAVIFGWLLLPGIVAIARPKVAPGAPGVAGGVAALVVGVALGSWAAVTAKTSIDRLGGKKLFAKLTATGRAQVLVARGLQESSRTRSERQNLIHTAVPRIRVWVTPDDGRPEFESGASAWGGDEEDLVEGQWTYVFYDPEHPGQCDIDGDRLMQEFGLDGKKRRTSIPAKEKFEGGGARPPSGSSSSAIPGSQPAEAASGPEDVVTGLKDLAQLHSTGALSDVEFAEAKSRLLADGRKRPCR